MSRRKEVALSRSRQSAIDSEISPMHALVKELHADLEAMRSKIPRYQYPHPKTRKLVRTYRSVPREFVQHMNESVRLSQELQAFNTYDPEAGDAALDFVDNFKMFRADVNSFLQGLSYTMEVRHAEVAEKALQTYQVAKVFRRKPGTSLGPHLTRLREALNRAGKKRRKKKEAAPSS
jgi:hypothetical protein